MKLNADIIYDNLSKVLDIEHHGHSTKELLLKRPRFYDGTHHELEANILYIALTNRLPPMPVIQERAVVMCVGGNPPLAYLSGKCSCLIIRATTDLMTVFNLVQDIFDKYDEWASTLNRIMKSNVSIKELIECSFPILGNPMTVMDSNYHFLAYSDIIDQNDDLANYRPDEKNSLPSWALSESIRKDNTRDSTKVPFLLTSCNVNHFVINLFDNNIYIGCFVMPFILREPLKGDMIVAQYLAKTIEYALRMKSRLSSDYDRKIDTILKDLINGFPLGSANKIYLSSLPAIEYVCANCYVILPSYKEVSLGYFCRLIEGAFSGSIAFINGSDIVAFIPLTDKHGTENKLVSSLVKLLNDLPVKIGASNAFIDLSKAQPYYIQTQIAFNVGSKINPHYDYHTFHDNALTYMVMHCAGGLDFDLLYKKGFDKLIEHDVTSSKVSYLDTLRVYLDCNMSITKATEALGIHRSTLIERLDRIMKLLEADLYNSDQRLHLQLCLKAHEINNKIFEQSANFEQLDHAEQLKELDRMLELKDIQKSDYGI